MEIGFKQVDQSGATMTEIVRAASTFKLDESMLVRNDLLPTTPLTQLQDDGCAASVLIANLRICACLLQGTANRAISKSSGKFCV